MGMGAKAKKIRITSKITRVQIAMLELLHCTDKIKIGRDIGYSYVPRTVTNIAFIFITCIFPNTRACQSKSYGDNEDDELRSKRTSTKIKIKAGSGCKVYAMFVHVLY